MDITQGAALLAALATAAAGLFAGFQVWELRKDRRKREHAEIAGVAVSWEVREKPRKAEDDEWATWILAFTAHNPGTLPVRNVEVDVAFPQEFRRVRHDGSVDEPARILNMGMAVLVGGSSKTWTRRIRLRFNENHSLRDIVATISFIDMEERLRSNEWSSPRYGRGGVTGRPVEGERLHEHPRLEPSARRKG